MHDIDNANMPNFHLQSNENVTSLLKIFDHTCTGLDPRIWRGKWIAAQNCCWGDECIVLFPTNPHAFKDNLTQNTHRQNTPSGPSWDETLNKEVNLLRRLRRLL